MLILSRKKDESLIIGGEIEIKIVEISDGKVRIGINAPKNIDVHRKEIYDLIQAENTLSSESKSKVERLAEVLSSISKDKKKE